MILSRRRVLFGILAAPIVVRSGLCMPVKALDVDPFEHTRLWSMRPTKLIVPQEYLGIARLLIEGEQVKYDTQFGVI